MIHCLLTGASQSREHRLGILTVPSDETTRTTTHDAATQDANTLVIYSNSPRNNRKSFTSRYVRSRCDTDRDATPCEATVTRTPRAATRKNGASNFDGLIASGKLVPGGGITAHKASEQPRSSATYVLSVRVSFNSYSASRCRI